MSGSLIDPNETTTGRDAAALQDGAGIGDHSGNVQVFSVHFVIVLGVCHSALQQLSHGLASGLRGLAQVRGSGLQMCIRDMIKAAVEQAFGVKVAKVNTIRMQGKVKRTGAYPAGKRAAYKKAVVTLTADSKTIEFFEGMV